jgi:hypothetical protein
MLDSLSGSHRSADTIRPRCRAKWPLRPRSLGGVKRNPGYTVSPGLHSTNEWRSCSLQPSNERWLPPHRHGVLLRARTLLVRCRNESACILCASA